MDGADPSSEPIRPRAAQAYRYPDHEAPCCLALGGAANGNREVADVDGAAVAAYRASVNSGAPLSERKLAAMFGKTSRRWARNRMAEAHQRP